MPITVLDAEDTKLNKINKGPYLMELTFQGRKQVSIQPTKTHTTMYWAERNALKQVKKVEAIRNRGCRGNFLSFYGRDV